MDISGTWYNELGSQVTLTVNGKAITGTYVTAVGDAEGEYDLVGQVDTDNDESQAVGWVVVWNNENGSADSVTAWSGQYQITDDGEEIISTTWLLTGETELDEDWASTLVGKDIFIRTQPAAEKVKTRLKRGTKQSSPVKKLD